MSIALHTGWTPAQVAGMDPRDLWTVIDVLTEPGAG